MNRSASSTWRRPSRVTRRPVGKRDARQAAGPAELPDLDRGESGLVQRASDGALGGGAAAVEDLGRVVGVVPVDDRGVPALAQDALKCPEQRVLAEVAAVGGVARVALVGELVGGDLHQLDADLRGDAARVAELVLRQARRRVDHRDRALPEGPVGERAHQGGVGPARIRDGDRTERGEDRFGSRLLGGERVTRRYGH